MPEYKVDINYIVPPSLAEQMINAANSHRDKLLVALLYTTGARPTEIRLLKRGDLWTENDVLYIKLKTLKLGRGKFFPQDRILKLKASNRYSVLIWDIIKDMPLEQRLISVSLRRVEQIVEKLSDKKICPYNFRHSFFTRESRNGKTPDELMYLKGAKTIDSISAYIRSKPVKRVLDAE